ncbi:hypothetical protein [Bacillus pseudomycoides]|uniref:Uncharacterized protein n=1 Tax=Bacillus pseudomycoides TaxID=64104 RepID=A0A2C4FSW2_9BACI|nr:hypothetical protein [Bacillus pseudomycoides]PDY45679.1 hypothetical protein CON79_18895 [Bacillus pseudomycoides]PEA83747.1 hypothetical protein CON99_10340 [Bacillus pseudomycoides]PED08629.1 hypothetical protein COO19_08975 [Bacillus pseudomycoides]PED69972.1 hypothetical protein CON97_22125 [Bacillus pseudomycoides]PEI41495.1 hypothetical protein CN620_12390 [Bacillus pseudomycoides]
MQTYTGATVIIKMLEGGIVQIPLSGLMFKIENGETLTIHPTATGWVYMDINIKFFFNNEFVDYVEALEFEVGEMLVFELKGYVISGM